LKVNYVIRCLDNSVRMKKEKKVEKTDNSGPSICIDYKSNETLIHIPDKREEKEDNEKKVIFNKPSREYIKINNQNITVVYRITNIYWKNKTKIETYTQYKMYYGILKEHNDEEYILNPLTNELRKEIRRIESDAVQYYPQKVDLKINIIK